MRETSKSADAETGHQCQVRAAQPYALRPIIDMTHHSSAWCQRQGVPDTIGHPALTEEAMPAGMLSGPTG